MVEVGTDTVKELPSDPGLSRVKAININRMKKNVDLKPELLL